MSTISSHRDLSGGFHPRVLVHVAREQAPEMPWLPSALTSCGPGDWESPTYVGYVCRANPNQPGAEWQFLTNVVLSHKEFGMVVLDILKGNRLGGIELLERIEG